MTVAEAPTNFIRAIIDEDLASGKHKTIVTRFPPEPNGYLHVGHCKAICLNFGLARDYQGECHLRMDDTNPLKESTEYVESIKRDVEWLGFQWKPAKVFHAADYFDQLYDFAIQLIKLGQAYVCDLNADQVREHRGTLTEPGQNSPFRERSVEENLDLFERMRAGEFADGARTLRAKIDMASPNIVLRDPTLYRIRKAHHHQTGDKWCIYPMYDYTHCLSDMLEGITHSLCSLEFDNNRALYDWVLDTLNTPCHPRQYEFSRLNLNYTVMSKRKLIHLVTEKMVSGWDDPRMPTISGMRRRGYRAEALRAFCDQIGVSKSEQWIDLSTLEQVVRDDLNTIVPRVMGVLKPLRLVVTNYPDGQSEELEAPYFPDEPEKMGHRMLPFSKVVYIERDDFMEDPPKKYFRLRPGGEVRLRRAYIVKCTDVVKNEQGEVVEVHCTYDPESRGGNAPDGRKVSGTIHWVSEKHSLKAEVRLYDRLFTAERPDREDKDDWLKLLNPESLTTVEARLEPGLKGAAPGTRYQFERMGYFVVDPDSTPEQPVFNRIVTLKDGWAKIVAKG